MACDDYDLELNKVAAAIKKQKARRVLLQLPDGLKQYATEIADELKEKLGKTKAEIFIWLGSCYGACDVPINDAREAGVDLIVQFGHSKFQRKFRGKIY